MHSGLNQNILLICVAAALACHCGFNPMKNKGKDKAASNTSPVPTKVEGAFLTACRATPDDGLIKAILTKYTLSPSQCDEASLRVNREVFLDLRSAEITDISALANLSQLRGLNIADNKVGDISVIASLPDLSFIDLSNNIVSRGPQILEACKLDWFSASENKLESLDFLASCHSLHTVSATSNPLVDLDFAKHLEDLVSIKADKTGVANISALAGKAKLAVVSLALSKVSDLSPLKDAGQLYYLDAGSTPLDKTDATRCPISSDVSLALRNYCNTK